MGNVPPADHQQMVVVADKATATLVMTNITHLMPLLKPLPGGDFAVMMTRIRLETIRLAMAQATRGQCFAGSSMASTPMHPAAERINLVLGLP
ncbi:hypothetical protein QJS10_CPB21g01017 [Acorus calamus]|uniref:Uncharacterized protein n=1 Tax=Acorus calamus TaxID=4465 RepID=A0AAV9C1S7_ACOCL|nr:hypothetical protein QJS10_CPB21g01017 [Acorus calamus]